MAEKEQPTESTFTQNEKEILDKMSNFRIDLEAILEMQNEESEESKIIKAIKYYENFEFDAIGEIKSDNGKIVVCDMYLVIKQNGDKLEYEIYSKDAQTLIATIDQAGKKIEFLNEGLKNKAKGLTEEQIELLQSLDKDDIEKDGQLRGLSRDATENEMEESLPEEDEIENGAEAEIEDEIEEDLAEDPELGEDLELRAYRQINEDEFPYEMRELIKDSGPVGFVYSGKLNSMICVQRTAEGFKRVEGIQPSKMTTYTVISMSDNGKKVEEKPPHALMKTDKPNTEIAVFIEQHGYLRFEVVQRTPNGKRIGRELRTDGKPMQDEEFSQSVDTEAERRELSRNYEKAGERENKLEDIEDDNPYRYYEDEEEFFYEGKETNIREQAEVVNKMSIEGYREILDKQSGTIQERVEETNKIIEEQLVRSGSRERTAN